MVTGILKRNFAGKRSAMWGLFYRDSDGKVELREKELIHVIQLWLEHLFLWAGLVNRDGRPGPRPGLTDYRTDHGKLPDISKTELSLLAKPEECHLLPHFRMQSHLRSKADPMR